MVKKNPNVFLDANIVIRSGKPPGGPEFERVVDLVDAGIVSVLTTDLTITEVSKKHADNDYDVIKEIGRPHFRRLVEEAVGAKIPEVKKAELLGKLNVDYHKSVSAMFEDLKAKVLPIDEVKPTAVFKDYAESTGFFSGEGKKDQFPDAFIFECLKRIASKDMPIIIVSDDGDFKQSAAAHEHMTLIKSLPELFSLLGFEVDAPPVQDFLNTNDEILIEMVNDELNDWGLIGDVEDSEIDDIDVTEIEWKKMTAFKPVEDGDDILVTGRLEVTANISFSHPDWDTAMYDSEDKVLIPFESVSGENEILFELDVSISIAVDEGGKPEELDMISFPNSDFQYVEIHQHNPYDYI